jgi:hypothetical protein
VQERYAEDQELQLAIEKQDVLLTRRLEQVRDIFARYSRLATLGQLVDVVLHDGLTYITQMGNEADLGRRNSIKLEQHLPGVSKLTSRFEKIGQYTHSLSQLFKRIEPFSGRARGRFEHIAIERIIENAINIFSRDIEQLGVKVEQMHTSTELRIVPGEVQQIFINLVQNSLYWLQQVPPGSRSISTQVQRISPVEVEVIFSDSGPGVSEEFRDLIFQPYFSGKPNGTGLGLTIAGETAAEYDGHLELISPGLLPGASFRLTLRQRSS